MEIVRKPTFKKHSVQQHVAAAPPTVDRASHQPSSVDYLDCYSRGYLTGKHDGTLAGLCIGTCAGIVAAVLISSLI